MHHPVHVPGFWGVFLVSNFIHLFIFISWRLITLQYCSGFCHTLKDGSDNPICKTEKETQIYRTDFWTVWEKARVGCFKRTASKHVYYLGWNRSPAQVGCMNITPTILDMSTVSVSAHQLYRWYHSHYMYDISSSISEIFCPLYLWHHMHYVWRQKPVCW